MNLDIGLFPFQSSVLFRKSWVMLDACPATSCRYPCNITTAFTELIAPRIATGQDLYFQVGKEWVESS